MQDGILYLASPYRHPDPRVVQDRVDAVCRAAADLIRQGWVVFSPIAHTHWIAKLGCLDPTHHETWMKQDLAMLKYCASIVVLDLEGANESAGIAAELEEAERLGIRTGIMRPETTDITWQTESADAEVKGRVPVQNESGDPYVRDFLSLAPKADVIDRPAHYAVGGIEVVDYMRAKFPQHFKGYCVLNVMKYLSRAEHKGTEIEDYKKALRYLQWLIDWENKP